MLCHLIVPYYFRRELTTFVLERVSNQIILRLWVPFAITQVTYVVINSLYLIAYLLEHPFLEQYKVHKNKAWPWKTNKNYRKQIIKCLLTDVFNNLLLTPLIGYLSLTSLDNSN